LWREPGGGGCYAIGVAKGSSEALIENNIMTDANKVMVFRSSCTGSVVGSSHRVINKLLQLFKVKGMACRIDCLTRNIRNFAIGRSHIDDLAHSRLQYVATRKFHIKSTAKLKR